MTGPVLLDDVEQRLPIPADVLVRSYTRDELSSGSAWWSPKHRVVLVLDTLRGPERWWALAHEVAHVLLGHHRAQGPHIETEADTLAAALLLGVVQRPGDRRSVRRLLASRGAAVAS